MFFGRAVFLLMYHLAVLHTNKATLFEVNFLRRANLISI